MCSGMRDAANLSWKIAAALRAGDPPAEGVGAGVDALLDTYYSERQPHLVATTTIAVTMGALVQLRRPRWLRAARDMAVGALYRNPLTRPFFLAPFTPPTALPAGSCDFHLPSGVRRWASAASAPAGAAPAAGWADRDAATGRAVPNYWVELANNGTATRLRLDALLTPEAGGDTGVSGPRAPMWAVIVSPRLSVARASDGDAPHPLRELAGLRFAAEARASHGAASPFLSCVVGVQLLPVSGSPVRVLRHARRVLGAAAHSARAGGAAAARAAYSAAVYSSLVASAAAQKADGAAPPAGGAMFEGGGASDEAHQWFAAADAAAADSGGLLALWLAGASGDVAIVRPDRVVYGVYTAAEFPHALRALERALGRGDGAVAGSRPGAASVWAAWAWRYAGTLLLLLAALVAVVAAVSGVVEVPPWVAAVGVEWARAGRAAVPR